jgi:hypothetical protein
VKSGPEIVMISDDNGEIIDIIHLESDPGTWIVRRRKRFLWMKRLISRDWFNDEAQALVFARTPKSV